MPGMMDSLATINSAARTLLMVVALGLVSAASWFGYRTYHAEEIALQEKADALDKLNQTAAQLAAAQGQLETKSAALAKVEQSLKSTQSDLTASKQMVADQELRIDELGKDLNEARREAQRLAASLKLLKVDYRVARLSVLEQETGDDGKITFSKVRFVEVGDDQKPIDEPKEFRLKGDIIYVDYWLVQFEDRYVEESDLDRATSICLFRRIWDEVDGPQGAHTLDEVGTRPNAYARGGKTSPFEKKIWDDFWNIANDPKKAKAMGIRAAHGQVPYSKVRSGKTYRLLLRASGGLSITPAEDDQSEPEPDKKPKPPRAA